MTLNWKTGRVLVAAGAIAMLGACEKGPMEKAGKAVDRAGEKTGDKVKEITK